MAGSDATQGIIETDAFASAVAQRASAVLAKIGSRSEVFSIGDLRFRLVAPTEDRGRWLGRAFPPMKSELGDLVSASSLHLLSVWDGTGDDELPPNPPWEPTDQTQFGLIGGFSDQPIRCAFDTGTNALSVYDLAGDVSHTWFPSIAALSTWVTAIPFRTVLSWHCNRHGMQLVHGAAVAVDGKAVLLAGKGGSGKSTTVLASALAGLGYIGDDYCAVEPDTAMIHMVYRTAKVWRPTLDLLPALEPLIVNPTELPADKGIMFFDDNDLTLVRSAQLSAILLPRFGTERGTKAFPGTHADAIRAILPSTILGLLGGTSATPRLIMQLARSVPVFHLELGTDLDAVPDAIARLLKSV
jgi:hypothetical protein